MLSGKEYNLVGEVCCLYLRTVLCRYATKAPCPFLLVKLIKTLSPDLSMILYRHIGVIINVALGPSMKLTDHVFWKVIAE